MKNLSDLINNLHALQEDLKGMDNTVATINANSDGMIEKECCHKGCSAKFYVHVEDWKNICRDEELFCPICSNASEAKSFMSSTYSSVIGEAFHRGVQNRLDGSNMPFRMKGLTIDTPGAAPNLYSCEACKTRFGTNQPAHICPSCGAAVKATSLTQ